MDKNEQQHVKSINTDVRGKNRLRYSSTRERAKNASADVYRSYKRRIGVTSAASREERVHHPHQEEPRKKRRRTSSTEGRVAILKREESSDSELETESTFASELDLAHDRNASEIFSNFYRDIWHLVRSLPEVLHHASEIVDLLLSYMLSPMAAESGDKSVTIYVTNQATTDILHLLAVLARDLRHEIHTFVHSKIVPRIIHDLLNPPVIPGRQPLPMNVTVVEAAFRALSYVFRYDSEPLLSEVDKPGQEPCLDKMRQYYGPTLGHKRDYVRRLAAETFAPMIRKLKTDSARKRHIRRVLRALASLQDLHKCAQSDAVNGVSFLLFETARGMSGRLHSKGHQVVRCVFDILVSSKENGVEMLRLVTSAFLDKICHHLERENFSVVWKETFRAADSALSLLMEASGSEESDTSPLFSVLGLIEQIVSFKNGIFIRTPDKSGGTDHHEECVKSLVGLLRKLLDPGLFGRLSGSSQRLVLQVLCESWRALPENPLFAAQISPLLPAILSSAVDNDSEREPVNPAVILARELLPFLPGDVGMKLVGRAVLVAAAKQASNSPVHSLMLLFSVVSVHPPNESDSVDDEDCIFFLENASFCRISSLDKKALVDLCLLDASLEDPDYVARLGVAARCLPFLLLAGCSKDDSRNEVVSLLKKICRWSTGVLKTFDRESSKAPARQSRSPYDDDIVVAKSLILESCARMTIACFEGDLVDSSIIKKYLLQMRPHADRLLLSHSQSLWAVKGVAAFVVALTKCDARLNGSTNEVFEALIPNLRQKNHFLRLHTLQILSSYPKRPFVTDHAEIDWTDDLDEEPSQAPLAHQKASPGGSTLPTGLCDIIETLLKLESTPINLGNERSIVSFITRVEVLGRTGRLPVLYAEAASNHMLGVLYVKFSPIWPAATRALVSLASGHESCVWQPLAERIRVVTTNIEDVNDFSGEQESDPIVTLVEHQKRCTAWETSSGSDPGIFRDDVVAAKAEGGVSRHLTTDEATIFRLVWSVLEAAPELTAKKSRAIVPIFLEFLQTQYFFYHENDPDARELLLHDEVDEASIHRIPRDRLSRSLLDKRLLAALKVFAVVNGPQQLYKHSLLLSIFTSFVSHQDASTAQAALSCVLKFKPPSITPYADQLKGLVSRGQMRDTMLKFNMSAEAKEVDPEHRASLIPLVTRILFGRLSSRVSIGRSSKDTPSARRAAVLSFLSVLDENDGELYPLFYMMVRRYIPKKYAVKPMELHGNAERQLVVGWLESITSDDISHLADQHHEGFLNLLSSGIAQLGHDIEKFVPAFSSILLALCKYSEVKDSTEVSNDDNMDESEGIDEVKSLRPKNRKGAIRTLCFRRLAEIHEKYASSIDFSQYAPSLWEPLALSVRQLPVTVAYAEKAPALLLLLRTLSSHPRLIPILSTQEEAVPSVIKCIADTSMPTVASSALDFVENLLTNGGEELDEDFAADSLGVRLIQNNLSLLLHQFTIRLGSGEVRKTVGVNAHFTTRRELSILCRLSSVLVRANSGSKGAPESKCEQEVLHMLCDLLLPFLSPERRISELDQLNVVGILSALFPRVEEEVALSHFPALSCLLGPYKAGRAITSLTVRKSIASVIETVAATCGSERDKIQAVAGVTVRLCAVHPKRVDEIDYDEVISVLNELGMTEQSSQGWLSLSGVSLSTASRQNDTGTAVLLPLVYSCFHFLYDEDGVVCRAAFKAIKSLISCAAKASIKRSSSGNEELSEHVDHWVKLVETSIVPLCRCGLACRNQSMRRLFILLFAELARWFKEYPSPNLYGDLSCLIRDDEPDLDFFLNVTHVQTHRRSRAFQRLSKMLVSESSVEVRPLFTMQTLSNVLLPLAMHAVYESTTKSEEALALDAAGTVGAIARHLSWSKYHASLWTLLNQFERHQEQERYLIEAICSVIDAFHFSLGQETDGASSDNNRGADDDIGPKENPILKALEKRIIPKLESLLVKEKVDRSGAKIKTIRPSVVLALLKLFQKFPEDLFEVRLTRLLVVICDALKSRESDARDVARKTLAKMTVEMGVSHLSDIIRQLALTLTEGYQLHVRMATLHTILQELAKMYNPQRAVAGLKNAVLLPFDSCIPAMMELIQEDLFGTARERKEAGGTKMRLVKEASGSKSVDSIELLCRMLLFEPSAAAELSSHTTDARSASSVHLVTLPLLERLRTSHVDSKTVGRIGECLTRVVVGLAHNETATPDEVLPFVYASLVPFVGEYQLASNARDGGDGESSGNEDTDAELQVSHTGVSGSSGSRTSNRRKQKKSVASKVVEWRPSALNAANSSADARKSNKQRHVDLHRVQDGASAPKLTGSGRYVTQLSSAQGLNEPASISAITFGLSLLYSSLKKAKFDPKDGVHLAMLDPFIPMLTTCVCGCRNNDVILLSLRCLGVLLRMNLASVEDFSSKLGAETLDILTSSGNISNLHQELTQACFKTLTLLIGIDASEPSRPDPLSSAMVVKGEQVLKSGKVMPLDAEQMQVLISLLKAAVVESDHHHPTLGLIKAIVTRRFVSPEFYDLMDTMMELSVRSQKATLRQLSAKIFMQYLVEYPMGKARLEDHLKRVVLNVKYEYEEGRLSGIALVTAIVEKLPVELLEERAQLFFLPLVLQFVNDESKECREALSKCLSRLLNRVPIDVVQSFYDYTLRWSSGEGQLQRTSLQLFGIFVDARPDFLSRGDTINELIERLGNLLSDPTDDDWEIQYFALLCMEKVSASSYNELLVSQVDMWMSVVDCLASSHPWINRVSSRMICKILNSLDPETFAADKTVFLVERPGSLYQVARNFCSHLDLDEAQQSDELSTSAIKSLTWIVQAMKHHPELCYAGDQDNRNPVTWLMTRLSSIAKPKGPNRRQAIFKCFAAFATIGNVSLVLPYSELMIEPLQRSITESENVVDSMKNALSGNQELKESEEATLAKDVLHVLEETCGDDNSEAFLHAYGAVNKRAREKREQRKQREATEMVRDPEAAAVRKMKKHEQEKRRKKRKVEERRRSRGGKAKRRHL